jgi:GNAT superfamily N-acetyltransferase
MTAPIAITVAASTADFDELHRLLIAYEDDLPPELRHGDVLTPAELARTFAHPNTAFLARFGGKPVGCVWMELHDAATAEIHRLYVTPNARTHGAGRALIAALISEARSRGCSRVILDTHKETLQAAYRLYTALGFVETAARATEVAYACPTFMELAL